MTQRHLDRAVARATGESLATIRRLGFGTADPALRFGARKRRSPGPQAKGGRDAPPPDASVPR